MMEKFVGLPKRLRAMNPPIEVLQQIIRRACKELGCEYAIHCFQYNNSYPEILL